MTDEIRFARVALSYLVEPGNRALWTRVAEHGPVRVLSGLCEQGGDRLRELAGARLATGDPRTTAEETLRRTHRLGARVVVPEDDEWPHQLDQLITICAESGNPIDRDAAPPLCLWVRGPWRVDEALERSVAVVGARAATAYGEHTARRLGYELAEREWSVVSGGAYGVDANAHRGALAAAGVTVVVLACGLDRPYPVSHTSLFERVAEAGLLVSEWPPGAEPFRHRFLIRNRVIAAATRGTVLVEANARSGARQTLHRAGQLGRSRMVVPGPITSAMSLGCHEELRQPGVSLVASVGHVLEEVGRVGADLAPVPRGPEYARDRLDPAEQRLVEALLLRKPLPAEAVAARAGVPLREAMRLLPSLALRGFARRDEAGFVAVRPEPAAHAPRPSHRASASATSTEGTDGVGVAP